MAPSEGSNCRMIDLGMKIGKRGSLVMIIAESSPSVSEPIRCDIQSISGADVRIILIQVSIAGMISLFLV